ncbi:MAG: hydrogenase expression/formation protein HypE, partial [Candidatus Micrarchaeota archaeon]|nr:hydrogenase expression/formation protein HypE [Candidatus Micrarchaeota archaeon]
MITLDHGAGGRKTAELVRWIASRFKYKNYNDVGLEALDDGSAIKVGGKHVVFSSDTYVVKPLFFRGGNIGKLAACGTINDVAVMGARPIAAHCNLLIEEGFDEEKLEKIIGSISKVFRANEVHLLGGDTKVGERGAVDGIAIGMFGIGIADRIILDSGLKKGDAIIVSGTIGDHEMAIMADRKDLGIELKVKSDCAPLYGMIEKAKRAANAGRIHATNVGKIHAMKGAGAGGVHAMKDITRGGLAGALNEFAAKSKVGIVIEEEAIPVRKDVSAACELLGFDVFNLACEGKIVMGAASGSADAVLRALKKNEYGKNARIVGEVSGGKGAVILKTKYGG